MEIHIPDLDLPIHQKPADTCFYDLDDPVKRLFIVRSGVIEVGYETKPGRFIIDLLPSPVILGTDILAGRETHLGYAYSYSDIEFQVVRRENLDEFLQDPDFLRAALLSQADQNARMANKLTTILKGRVPSVSKTLVDLARERNTDQIEGLTQQQIGDLAGCTRESVTKIYASLIDKSAISLETGHGQSRAVRILDKSFLEALANCDNSLQM